MGGQRWQVQTCSGLTHLFTPFFALSTAQYSPVHTRFLHWLSLFPMKENTWSTRCSCPDCPNFEEQEWRSGESACLSPMWSGFDLSLVPYVGWVCFSSVFALFRGFCSGILDFLSPQKESPKKQLRLILWPSLRPNVDHANFTYEVALSNVRF